MENDLQMEKEEKTEYIDAINKYYELKNEYDENINKIKKKIIKLEGLSWKEKRIEFQKIKPKCINCKRPVGSIFDCKMNKKKDELNRILTAMCGDRNNPCPFNIVINLALTDDIRNIIDQDNIEISKYKKEIIIDKNDLLFGYISSDKAVSKFDIIKDDVKNLMSIYEHELNYLNNIIDNSEKKESLKKIQNEIYTNIENMNTLLSQFEKEQNDEYMIQVIELYNNDLIPKLKEFMYEKYDISQIEYDDYQNVYKLIQIPFSIESYEYEYPLEKHQKKIQKMIQGMKKK